VFPLFFLLSAAFLSVLRAAGPSLHRVSLCFGLLTAAAISCFGLVKVSKKRTKPSRSRGTPRPTRTRFALRRPLFVSVSLSVQLDI
jgi:hypothetical protein